MKDPLYQLEPVETQIYEPHPDYPGCQRSIGGRPWGEVMHEIDEKLESIDLGTGEGDFGLFPDWRTEDALPSWYTRPVVRDRLMVGRRPLKPAIEVQILVPEPIIRAKEANHELYLGR